jgi:3-oxoacyl-[acyl-carrier protein] reductase
VPFLFGGRAGEPAEVADAIRYISSPQAGYLTGQTIFLDGGMTAA